MLLYNLLTLNSVDMIIAAVVLLVFVSYDYLLSVFQFRLHSKSICTRFVLKYVVLYVLSINGRCSYRFIKRQLNSNL